MDAQTTTKPPHLSYLSPKSRKGGREGKWERRCSVIEIEEKKKERENEKRKMKPTSNFFNSD